MLNTGKILDDALSTIQENSAAVRSKMLKWLNVSIQRLVAERDWIALQKTKEGVTISDNKAPLPDDCAAILTITGESFFLTRQRHHLTDEEANSIGASDDNFPAGFVVTPDSIVFVPGATGSVDLKYLADVPVYGDGEDTIFPPQFAPILMRSCLDFYYEYDMDERQGQSYSLDRAEMYRLKSWDNRLKPKPKPGKYLRA